MFIIIIIECLLIREAHVTILAPIFDPTFIIFGHFLLFAAIPILPFGPCANQLKGHLVPGFHHPKLFFNLTLISTFCMVYFDWWIPLITSHSCCLIILSIFFIYELWPAAFFFRFRICSFDNTTSIWLTFGRNSRFSVLLFKKSLTSQKPRLRPFLSDFSFGYAGNYQAGRISGFADSELSHFNMRCFVIVFKCFMSLTTLIQNIFTWTVG